MKIVKWNFLRFSRKGDKIGGTGGQIAYTSRLALKREKKTDIEYMLLLIQNKGSVKNGNGKDKDPHNDLIWAPAIGDSRLGPKGKQESEEPFFKDQESCNTQKTFKS